MKRKEKKMKRKKCLNNVGFDHTTPNSGSFSNPIVHSFPSN